MTTTPTILSSEEVTVPVMTPQRAELRWPLLLIALLTVYTGVFIRHSYFWADDFLSFGFAHQLGLGSSLVFLNLFGHIAPTERLLHYLSLAISPFNYAVAETIILIIYAALLLSFLWVLRELRVGTAVTLVLLFVAGTSTILLNETLYYDQTTFLLPASAFILCVTALFIRWTRTGQGWALYLSWFVFALSFITQERPLVVLIYIALLRYVVLPYRQAPGGKHRWLSDWRIWLPYGCIAGAYVGYYLTIAPHSRTNNSLIIDFFRLAGEAFLHAAIGLPIANISAWITWVELVVVLLIVGTLLAFSSRRQIVLRAVVFFVVCFLVNLGAVVHGLGGIFGAQGVAFQIQYYVDALFALGLAVGIVCSDWVSRGRTQRPRHTSIERDRRNNLGWVVAGCAGVVLIHFAVLPQGIPSIDRGNDAQPIARAWMSNLRGSLAALSSARPATVIPLSMPASFDPGFEAPYDFESGIFPLLPEWHDYDTGPVEVAGPSGALVPSSAGDAISFTGGALAAATVVDLTPVSGPPGAVCYQSNDRTGQLRMNLPHVVKGGVVAADLSLTSESSFTITPFSVYGDTTSLATWPATVRRGTSRILVSLPGGPVNTVGFAEIPPGVRFCITALQIGSVLVHSSGAACNEIDVYGSSQRRGRLRRVMVAKRTASPAVTQSCG